ncbi:MAG: hypothetical protein ACJ8AT_24930 [Hyalangium sp.]
MHRSVEGEALLLRVYLAGEEYAENDALLGRLKALGPAWLSDGMERHLADERRHAALLRARLAELGADPAAHLPGGVDGLEAGKLRRLRALVTTYAKDFEAGERVPLLAVAARMEAMSVRIFQRHVEVLEAWERESGAPHPTAELLRSVVKDEQRHVRGCELAIERLVQPQEREALAALGARIEAIERRGATAGALALWAVGVALRLRQAGAHLQPFRQGRREEAA